MTDLDFRLALPAVVAWMTTALIIANPGSALALAVALWIAAGLACAAGIAGLRRVLWSRWMPTIAVALAAAALCTTAVTVGAQARSPAVLVGAAESGRSVTLLATLTQTAHAGEGHVNATVVQVGETRVSVPVVVFAGLEERLPLGSAISIRATVAVTEPGDHASFLLFARTPPDVLERPPPWLGWADDLRARFLTLTGALPGEGGDLLGGLAIGDTTAVGETLDSAMKESSLSHLTAVSGANCAVVVGLIMVAGASVGIPRLARVLTALAALIGFVVLVTPEPSVLRAAVMATIVLGALASGRATRGLPVLAAATVALLVIDPWLAREFGFALSVLATAGLLILAGPLTDLFSRVLPRPIALVLAVPAAAQLACQPVIVLLDASIPTFGVVANVLAAPAAPVATMLGLAACLTSGIVPMVAGGLAWMAWLPSTWIAGVATFFAGLPLARLPWPEGGAGAALLATVSAVGVLVLFASSRVKRWAAFALCGVLAAYGGIVGGSAVISGFGRPDWQIAACEVGQGDAFIVRSAGQIALVDAGVDPELLSDCLADLRIDHIDLLVLSHFDRDHVGGVSAVFGAVDIALVGPTSGETDEQLLQQLANAGAEVHSVAEGARGTLGELAWRVLWPPPKLAGIEPGNDASIVLEFRAAAQCTSGCLSSLFLGDLGESSQARLLASGDIKPVDVIKVSHHGSADQHPELYLAARATVGLIGVGENDYGHPTATALDMLAAAGTVAYRTDESGLILVAPGDEAGSVRVWTKR